MSKFSDRYNASIERKTSNPKSTFSGRYKQREEENANKESKSLAKEYLESKGAKKGDIGKETREYETELYDKNAMRTAKTIENNALTPTNKNDRVAVSNDYGNTFEPSNTPTTENKYKSKTKVGKVAEVTAREFAETQAKKAKYARIEEEEKQSEYKSRIDSISDEEKDLLAMVYSADLNPNDLQTGEDARKTLKEKYGYSDNDISAMSIYQQRLNTAEDAENRKAWSEQFMDEHPVLGGVASASLGAYAGAVSKLSALANVKDAATLYASGEKPTLDTNFYGNVLSNQSAYLRDRFMETHNDWTIKSGPFEGFDVGDFLYSTGMSMADSVLAGVIGGGVDKALNGGNPIFGKLNIGNNEINLGAGGLMLGLNSATQTMNDLTEKGASAPQAIAGGLASGVFEMFFEDVSLSNLEHFSDLEKLQISLDKDGLKNAVRQIAGTTFTNATEEGFTEIANILYDTLANGGISDYQTSVRAYLQANPDMTYGEASKLAIRDLSLRVLESAAGGALMGAVMGGGGTSLNLGLQGAYKVANKALPKVEEKVTGSSVYTQREQRKVNMRNRAVQQAVTNPTISVKGKLQTINGNNVSNGKFESTSTKTFSDENGKTVAKGSVNGETYTAKDIADNTKDYNVKTLYSYVAEKNLKADDANMLISRYDGASNVDGYIKAYEAYRKAGQMAAKDEYIKAITVDTDYSDYFTQEEQDQIMRSGLESKDFKVGLTDFTTVNKGVSTKIQMAVVNSVAKKLGKEVVLFDDFKREMNDEDVAWLNGVNLGDNRIALSAKAEGGLILRTFAHEIGHSIKVSDKKAFDAIADVVVESFKQKGEDVSEYIKKYGNTSNQFEELVCDSMYDVLFDERVLKSILKDPIKAKAISMAIKKVKPIFDSAIEMLSKGNKKEITVLNDNKEALRKISDIFASADKSGVKDTTETEEGTFRELDDVDFSVRKNNQELKVLNSLTNGNAKVKLNQNNDLLLGTSDNGRNVFYSTNTLYNGGLDTLETVLRANGHSEEEVKRVTDQLKTADKYLHDLADKYGYKVLTDHLNANIITDVKTGRQIIFPLVSNGDYPVNIDLALICKKRVAYMKLMTRLIEDGVMRNVRFGGDAIAKANEILRDAGLETACLGCFVEARRLQFQNWAETICQEWNDAVDKLRVGAPSFDFAGGIEFDSGKMSESEITALDDYMSGVELNDKGNIKVKDDNGKTVTAVASKMYWMLKNLKDSGNTEAFNSLAKHLTVSDLLTPEGLNNLRAYDQNIFSIVKQRYGAASPKIVQEFSPYSSEIALISNSTVKQMTGKTINGLSNYLKDAEQELIREGRIAPSSKNQEENILWKADIENRALQNYFSDIGGVRMQSFSDFMIENTLDYLQLIADLEARKFTMHTYTKEISELRMFGMTGIKGNGSLIAHCDPKMGKALAGLLPYNETTKKQGIPVTYKGTKYILGFDDYERYLRTSKSTDEDTSYIQSIGYKDIISLILDKRYSKNIGSICIGVSDAQITAMLDCDYIRMIIPYHKSGMLPEFAKLVGVDLYTDYTKHQNTKLNKVKSIDGKAIALFEKKISGSKARGDEIYETQAKLIVGKKDGKDVYAGNSQVEHYDWNKKVHELGGAKEAAADYIKWCNEWHEIYNSDGELIGYATYTPKFNQFSYHKNYYKVLEDFNSYDGTTSGDNEVAAQQEAVRYILPSEETKLSNSELAEYRDRLTKTGLYTKEEIDKYLEYANMTFEQLLDKEVKSRKEYSDYMDDVWEDVVGEVEDVLLNEKDKKGNYKFRRTAQTTSVEQFAKVQKSKQKGTVIPLDNSYLNEKYEIKKNGKGIPSSVNLSTREVSPININTAGWNNVNEYGEVVDTKWYINQVDINGNRLFRLFEPNESNKTEEQKELEEKGHKTQNAMTMGSYKKFFGMIQKQAEEKGVNVSNMKILDASSGLGLGTRYGRDVLGLDIIDVEPFASPNKYGLDMSIFGDKRYPATDKSGNQKYDKKGNPQWAEYVDAGTRSPDYTDYGYLESQIEKGNLEKFDAIISNMVINVTPYDQRNEVVASMGRMLKNGGKLYINTMDNNMAESQNAITTIKAKYGSDGKIISGGEYYKGQTNTPQKGFTETEMKAYLNDVLTQTTGAKFDFKYIKSFGSNSTTFVVTKIGDGISYKEYAKKNNIEFSTREFGMPIKTNGGGIVERFNGVVGKNIGTKSKPWVYFHAQYVDDMIRQGVFTRKDFEKALRVLKNEHPKLADNYNHMAYQADENKFTFAYSDNFDTAREPKMGETFWVNLNTGKTSYSADNKRILHHKWAWVKNDYDGFDVQKSWEWSNKYIPLLEKHPEISGYGASKGIPDGTNIEKWTEQLNAHESLRQYANDVNGNAEYSTRDSEGNELSPQQQEFFKNSKVRDEDGNLKVMYHGTSNTVAFTKFNTKDSVGVGSFFSDNVEVSSVYAGVTILSDADIYHPSKTYDIDTLSDIFEYYDYDMSVSGNRISISNGESNHIFNGEKEASDWAKENLLYYDFDNRLVYGVYLNIENPLVIDAKHGNWDMIPDFNKVKTAIEYAKLYDSADGETFTVKYSEIGKDTVVEDFDRNELEAKFGKDGALMLINGDELQDVFIDENGEELIKTTNEWTEYAYDNGYDGVIFNNIYDGGTLESTVCVAFNPNQIKDTENKNPTSDPDIRYSTRDAEYMSAVKSNDMAKAQKMVDVAAKEAGYVKELFHGTDSRNHIDVFDEWKANYFSPSKEYSEQFGDKIYRVYVKSGKVFDTEFDETSRQIYNNEFVPYSKERGWNRYGIKKLLGLGELSDFTTADDLYAFLRMRNRNNKEKYDSIRIFENGAYAVENPDADYAYIPLDNRNIKSSETVTYDDNGNIIPLSERFNSSNPDIRYSARDVDGQISFLDMDDAKLQTGEQLTFDTALLDVDDNTPKLPDGRRADQAGNTYTDEERKFVLLGNYYIKNKVSSSYNKDNAKFWDAWRKEFDDYFPKESINSENGESIVRNTDKFIDTVKNTNSVGTLNWMLSALREYYLMYSNPLYIEKNGRLNYFSYIAIEDCINARKNELENKPYGTNVNVKKGEYSQDQIEKMFRVLNTSEELNDIAEKVFKLAKEFNVRYVFGKARKGNAGEAVGNRIVYDIGYFNNEQISDNSKAATLLHEAIHTVTVYAVSGRSTKSSLDAKAYRMLGENQKKASWALYELYDEAEYRSKLDNKDSYKYLELWGIKQYGIRKNQNEYVAELADIDLRYALSQEDIIGTTLDGKFKNIVFELLGYDTKDKNMLQVTEGLVNYLVDYPDQDTAIAFFKDCLDCYTNPYNARDYKRFRYFNFDEYGYKDMSNTHNAYYSARDDMSGYYSEVIRENRRLQTILASLGDAYSSIRKDTYVSKDRVRTYAQELVNKYNSTMDVNALTDRIYAVYDWIDAQRKTNKGYQVVDTEQAVMPLREIANDIMMTSTVVDTTKYDMSRPLRKYLREHTLYVTEEESREIPDFMAEKKLLGGRVRVSIGEYDNRGNKRVHLADAWNILCELSGGTEVDGGYEYVGGELNPDTNQKDMLRELFEYFQSHEKTFVTGDQAINAMFNMGMLDSTEAEADVLASEMLENHLKMISEKEPSANQKLTAFLHDLEMQTVQLRENYKNDAKKSYEEKLQAYKDKREMLDDKRVFRNKIQRDYNYVSRRWREQSAQYHITDNMKGLAEKYLKSFVMANPKAQVTRFDKVAMSDLARQMRLDFKDDADIVELAQKLEKFSDEYHEAKYKGYAYDTDALANISVEDLQTISNVSAFIKHRIEVENNLVGERRKEDLKVVAESVHKEYSSMADKTIANINPNDSTKARIWSMSNKINLGLTKPYYLVQNCGSSTMKGLLQDILYAENTEGRILDGAKQAIVKAKENNKYDPRWKDTKVKLTLGGQFTEITVEDAMSLYALSKRPQALQHLLSDGIEIYSVNKDGDRELVKRRMLIDELRYLSETVLPDNAKSYVDEVVGYITKEIGSERNKITEALYGFKKYTEEYYFPIKVSSNERDANSVRSEELSALKNGSATKSVSENAKQAIVVDGFSDTVYNHIYTSAMYCAYVLPIENFTKVLNYRYNPNYGEIYGDVLQGGKIATKWDIQTDIKTKMGTNYFSSIMDLVRDVNSGNISPQKLVLMNKFITNMKKASTMANISVVVQQPMAVVRAFMYVEPKYFGKTTKADMDEMYANNGAALKKDIGYFDVNMGRSVTDWLDGDYTPSEDLQMTFKERVKSGEIKDTINELAGWGANKADEITWVAIWKACRNKVKAENGNLSEADQMAKASKLFSNVVGFTQVYDSVFSKCSHMRNKDSAAQMLMSFKAEPITTLNMIAQASHDYITNKNNYTKKRFFTALTCFVGSMVATNLTKAMWGAFRDDDDEYSWLEKVIAKLSGGVIGDVFGLLPYLGDIYNVMQGYDITRMDTNWITTLIGVVNQATKEDVDGTKLINKILELLSQLSGYPIYAAKRDATTIIRTGKNVVSDVIGYRDMPTTTADGMIEALQDEFSFLN